MKVFNVEISGLESSINACRYPTMTEFGPMLQEIEDRSFDRAKILAKHNGGGHDQFLTGITVNFDVTGTIKWWTEAERYRFLNFVSSSSTMKRITEFKPFGDNCCEYVHPEIIKFMMKKIEEYETLSRLPNENLSATLLMEREKELDRKYLEILYNCPTGFELTARLTTNYRSLSNIYRQRINHRLPEWREFCHWIETLPYANELLMNK